MLAYRYGLDVIMNTDMFQQPEAAAEELSLKLRAQRYQMHESWIGTCYQEVLNNSPTIIDAALRAHPTKGVKKGLARRIEAAKMHANLFAANEKDENPVPILISALAWGGVYMPVGGAPSSGGVLLTPPGFSISRFTRPTEMQFWLSGLTKKEHGPIPYPLDNVRRDTEYGVNIMTHFPPADYTKTDTEDPQVTFNELLRRVAISNHYPIDFLSWTGSDFTVGITDFKEAEKGWIQLSPEDIEGRLRANFAIANHFIPGNDTITITYSRDTTGYDTDTRQLIHHAAPKYEVTGLGRLVRAFDKTFDEFPNYDFTSRFHQHYPTKNYDRRAPIDVFLWRPHMVLEMYSALYCARPGPDTGFMMLGYPKSTISIQEDTQELLITLRQRHGCGIVNRQNLCLLPDIQCGGMIMGHGIRLSDSTHTYKAPEEDDDEYDITGHDLVLMCKLEKTPWMRLLDDPLFVAQNLQGPLSDVIKQKVYYDNNEQFPDLAENIEVEDGNVLETDGLVRRNEMTIFSFSGAVWDKDMKQIHTNTGHLEDLDRETACDALEGRLKTRPYRIGVKVD